MELTVNSVIKYVSITDQPMLEVVLWINSNEDLVVTYNLNNKNSLPILKKHSEIDSFLKSYEISIITNPFYKYIDESKISDKHKTIRDNRWKLIQSVALNEPDIYMKSKRNKLIKDLITTKGLSHHKDIYKYLRLYWMNGKTINSLLPNYSNSGGKGKDKSSGALKRGRSSGDIGINITPETKKIIEISFNKFYNKTKLSFRLAHQQMLENYFNEGYYTNDQGILTPLIKQDIPSIRQFIYWGKKAYSTKDMSIKREGIRNHSLNHRAIIGESTSEAYSPGRLFQVDATIADIYLVSRINPNWIIGRPVVYMVIDVFSRLIAGFYVGLEGPSWLGGMMAIYNTTRNKVDLCNEYDIPIAPNVWTCNHLPENLIADRGEFESNKTANLKANLGVNIKILPPYRADWKGIVEQNFRKFNNKTIHWLKGSIKKEYRIRGEEDYRLGAMLNLYEFTQIIIYSILYFNNSYMNYYERDEQMIRDNVPPIPNELWKWGIKNRSGSLKTYSDEIIKLNLMPSSECSLTEIGLMFQCRRYNSKEFIDSGIYEHIRKYGNIKKSISYDPRNPNYVYVNEGDHFIKMLATNSNYANVYFEEIECLQSIDKADGIMYEKIDYQNTASMNSNINNTIFNAKKREKEYDISKKKRIESIKDNRRNEKEVYRQFESWELDNGNSSEQEIKCKEQIMNESDNEYVPRPKFTNIINMDIESETYHNEQ